MRCNWVLVMVDGIDGRMLPSPAKDPLSFHMLGRSIQWQCSYCCQSCGEGYVCVDLESQIQMRAAVVQFMQEAAGVIYYGKVDMVDLAPSRQGCGVDLRLEG